MPFFVMCFIVPYSWCLCGIGVWYVYADQNSSLEKSMAVQPVVKWVGGKRQLLPEIVARVPKAFDPGTSTYYEPFLGGAAVLFGLSHLKKLWSTTAMRVLSTCIR